MIKTTHEIWKEHYHNNSEPEGKIPCKKKWIGFDEVIKKILRNISCESDGNGIHNKKKCGRCCLIKSLKS